MYRLLSPLLTVALLLAWSSGSIAQGSLSTLPTCPPTPVQAYQQGFDAGVAAGIPQGYDAGVSAAIGSCQVDPGGCGISLGACLTAPQYGETEPNNNLVTADLLVLDTKFWGQSSGLGDEDWYYVITSVPNQTLILNFSVPGGTLAGWNLSVRDAAGNIFAQFDTGAVASSTSPSGDITYRVTLGLVGTYYIALKPQTLSYEPYNLAAILQNSPLETQNFIVGFFDAEVEPNNDPSQWNQLTSGVTMYGLINLSFAPGTEVADPEGDGFEYAQGADDDWYLYPSAGNEVLTISACNRDVCTRGNWLFEVFDERSAFETAAGIYAPPLLAFNSETGDPNEFVMGIANGGNYYVRVTHKRLLTALCAGYTFDIDKNGLPDADGDRCGCESGNSCDIDITNPGEPIVTTDPETGETTVDWPLCPNGSGGGENPQCTVGCICTSFRGVLEVPAGALTSQYNFTVYSTMLPPNTADTEAYEDFLNRPNPYNP